MATIGGALMLIALAGLGLLAWREARLLADYPACRVARRYVALGSSSTAGVGASNPARTGYVALIASQLQARCPDLALTNMGVGGLTVAQIAAQIPAALEAKPQVVTIFPLVDYWENDAAAFAQGYADVLDQLGAAGATVFFGDLRLDPRQVCGRGGLVSGCFIPEDEAKIARKNRALAELARTRPWVVIVPVPDQRFAHPDWQLGDGLHVNDRGHADFAAHFERAIGRWLAMAEAGGVIGTGSRFSTRALAEESPL
jgi:lysophospholipase L1-like esterase